MDWMHVPKIEVLTLVQWYVELDRPDGCYGSVYCLIQKEEGNLCVLSAM